MISIFKENIPIYIQISNDIKEQIIRGSLNDGDKLPSIREYSSIYAVTSLTIQRALGQLESEGIIISRKGIGNFILDGSTKILSINMIQYQIKNFIKSMKNMGLCNDEIITLLQEELNNE